MEKYENTYKIKYFDIDKTETATVNSIVEYMQEASSEHTHIVGCTPEYMRKNGIAWLLIESCANIYKLPKFGENITVRTWACGVRSIYTYRRYEVFDENNEIIAEGNSKWILYSNVRNRPIKIPDEVYNMYVHFDEDTITDNFIEVKDEKIYDDIRDSCVLYRDVDTNWHMNNVKYLRIAIESMKDKFLEQYTIDKYSIKYIRQILYNEKFNICRKQISDDEYMYYINQENNNKNNCEIYIKWKKK